MLNLRNALVVTLLGLLAACSLPRGAALQSEVLAAANEEFPQIAVYPVTRAKLAQYARWPRTGKVNRHGWISHQHQPAELTIKPFDRVDLVIWDSEENSLLTSTGQKLVEIKNIRVNQAGRIFVPYLGEQTIAGRTPDAARRQLEREMTQLIPSAQVQLNVLAGTRSTVSLVGGVSSPGPIPLPEGHFTVLNLISMGGGPQANLRNPQVRLIRNGRTYMTSLQRLYENPSLDAVVKGGDKVALEADNRYFRALGASGREELVYFIKDNVSALDAVSLIGGLADDRADPQGVLVLRQYPASAVGGTGPENTRSVFIIDLTSADGLFSAGQFRINPQDTVLVTESPVTDTRTIFQLVGSAFGLARQAQ